MLKKPEANEYPEWYHGYIQLLPEGGILMLMKAQLKEIDDLISGITEEKALFRYEKNKWSIKEILGHINDAERIFSYRALRFARQDKTDLPQYDHDKYVETANFDSIELNRLLREFNSLRSASIELYESIKNEQWLFTGLSGGQIFSLRSMPYITTGHAKHHIEVMKDRYL